MTMRRYTCLMIATSCFGAVPLYMHLGTPGQSPVWYFVILQLSAATTWLFWHTVLFRCTKHRANMGKLQYIMMYVGESRSIPIGVYLLGFLGSTSYLFMAWAMRYIDTEIIIILFGTWAMFVFWIAKIFLKIWPHSASEHHVGNHVGLLMACVLFFLGAIVVVASQYLSNSSLSNDSGEMVLLASGLALVGGLLRALYVVCDGVAVKENLTAKTLMKSKGNADDRSPFRYRVFHTASLVWMVMPIIPLTIVALILGYSISLHGGINAAVTGLVVGIGDAAWRQVTSPDPTRASSDQAVFLGAAFWPKLTQSYHNRLVTILFLFAPAYSLYFLLALGLSSVERWDVLIIGIAAIITGTVLNYSQEDHRLSHTALVLSLWIFGLVTYLWPGVEHKDYYQTVLITATMFVLLLSFSINRLVRQKRYEKQQFIDLREAIDKLAPSDSLEEGLKALKEIDEPKSSRKLPDACKDLHVYLTNDGSGLPSEVHAKAKAWMVSRQQRFNLAEMASLIILGGLTVFGLLFFVPEGLGRSPWEGVFAKLTAAVISATVVFLCFTVWDLERERRISVDRLERTLERNEQYCAFVFCFAICGTYGWLLLSQSLG